MSNIRSILEYVCIVWEPSTENLMDRLESIQNRAARFLTHNYQFPTSIAQIKNSLVWRNPSLWRTRFRICLRHDVYLQSTAVTRDLYLQPPTYVSTLRDHQFEVREIVARTSTSMNSFFPHSIKHWNRLLRDLMGIRSDDRFFKY